MAKLGNHYYLNPYNGQILRNLDEARKSKKLYDYPPHLSKSEFVRIVKQTKRDNPPRIFHHRLGKKRFFVSRYE
jgi:hypothetical protein